MTGCGRRLAAGGWTVTGVDVSAVALERAGGTLLVVTHHADDLHANVGRKGEAHRFLSAEQLASSLAGGDGEILVAEAQDRSAQDLDGQPTTVRDTVLRAARRR